MNSKEMDAYLKEYTVKQQAALKLILEKNHGINTLTAIVMANDYCTREVADLAVQQGMAPIDAGNMVGSFARLDWFIEKYEASLLPPSWLWRDFPDEWVSCDPDDTNPKYLELWKSAYKENCGIVLDKAGLSVHASPRTTPLGRIHVYRGQQYSSDPLGISWTTDLAIAEKFALGAALRIPTNGVVIEGFVELKHVLAYLTGRGESELIVDPVNIRSE